MLTLTVTSMAHPKHQREADYLRVRHLGTKLVKEFNIAARLAGFDSSAACLREHIADFVALQKEDHAAFFKSSDPVQRRVYLVLVTGPKTIDELLVATREKLKPYQLRLALKQMVKAGQVEERKDGTERRGAGRPKMRFCLRERE